MSRSCRRFWHQRGRVVKTLVAAVSPLAVLLASTAIGADSAAAAPLPGYTVSRIPTGVADSLVAVNPVTNTVYLGWTSSDAITVVDGSTNTVTGTILLAGFGVAGAIAVDPATDTLYATVMTSPPTVEAIDFATNTQATIPLPANSLPWGIAVDSVTDTVYVSSNTLATVTVIDGSTNKVTATVSTGSAVFPVQLTVDEISDVVWVADTSGNVVAISGSSNKVTQTISLGAQVRSVAVNPATDTVYAATSTDGVAVINGGSGAVSSYISGPAPFSVAFDPGSDRVFASTYVSTSAGGAGTTWIIDASSNSLVDTIPRGGMQIAVNTATGSAYVAPSIAQTTAAWLLTPSATDAWSPIVKSTTTAFTAGNPGSFAIIGTALPAATYTETGTLPSGVTLSSSGVLSGTPATGTGGSYPISLAAANGIAPDYSETFTLIVDEAPAITSVGQATFHTGVAGSFTMTTTGYPPPVMRETGTLPAGVLLSGSGVLSGTPAAGTAGVYPIEVTADNGHGTATQAFTLTVDSAPAITSVDQATFQIGVAGSFAVTATGSPTPTLSESGPLPEGVTFSAAGVLSGTPLAGTAGVYPLTVTATSSAGSTTQAFTLTVVAPAAIAVGAEGTDGQLWVRAPQLSSGWHPLGGKIVGPPAVAAAPNPNGATPASPLFIATGTDKHLYIRSLTAGWQRISPLASCLGSPAAMITGSTLTVACRGTDNALYYDTATLTGSTLPVTFNGGWKNLGGVLTAGPAVAPIGGATTFFVLGTTGHIYTRTVAAGYTEKAWACLGQPAAALQAATGVTVFACQGTNHALYWSANSGSGWGPTTSLGGTLAAGPAVAATSQVPVFLAESSTNRAVYQRTPVLNWTTLGGTVVGGIGAVALN